MIQCGSGLLWRGGLPPLGREAAPKPETAVCQAHRMQSFTTASQPNGGKPPHHKSPLPQVRCKFV
ncbi:hypothetical protein C1884_28525 [Pseudomonas sp. GW460-R15]|nr:hypothetical protein C1887_28530 [Pseudomonas sp. GW456-R21]POA61256.1 hypothetical protein C1884_28525 [Pseudomonas sp. GW460-R15]